MTLAKTRRYTIAGIQIFGGLVGAGSMADVLVNAPSWSVRLMAGAVVVLFTTSFTAGMLLLRGHRWGAPLSMYLQVPQLISVYSSRIVFEWYSGFKGGFSFTTPFHLGLSFSPGSDFEFYVLNDFPHTTIGLNIVAAIIMWQLLQYLDAEEATAEPLPPLSLSGTV